MAPLVYISAVCEYIAAGGFVLAGNVATDNENMRIIPRHIQFVMYNDDGLSSFCCPTSTRIVAGEERHDDGWCLFDEAAVSVQRLDQSMNWESSA